jgi:membrane protein required for beta-lactamase induction
MGFSVVGFVVGAVLAIIFFVVATALVVFAHSGLVFGLIALLIWAACAFYWRGPRGRRTVV